MISNHPLYQTFVPEPESVLPYDCYSQRVLTLTFFLSQVYTSAAYRSALCHFDANHGLVVHPVLYELIICDLLKDNLAGTCLTYGSLQLVLEETFGGSLNVKLLQDLAVFGTCQIDTRLREIHPSNGIQFLINNTPRQKLALTESGVELALQISPFAQLFINAVVGGYAADYDLVAEVVRFNL